MASGHPNTGADVVPCGRAGLCHTACNTMPKPLIPLNDVKPAWAMNFELSKSGSCIPPVKNLVSPFQQPIFSLTCNAMVWLRPNITVCEGRQSNEDLNKQLRQDISHEKARVEAEIDRPDNESCLSCLVTGVGTCGGLAGYFGYLAMEEMHVQQVTTQVRQRIAFFGIMSVGWVGVGAYRLYLG